MNMQNWKDPNGGVHGIDADDPAQLAILAQLKIDIPGTWTNVTGSWPPPPTQAEQLAAQVSDAFSAGVNITSTSTPAVNGTYAIDSAAQQRINGVETFILKNNAFPGSSGTQLGYPDKTGVMHVFPSLAIWNEFATAVANHVADLDLYAAGASGATLPSPDVTIA